MKSVYIILASQEYDNANHKNLWLELSNQTEDDLLVMNIPADYCISLLKGKNYRLKEAKQAPRRETKNMMVVRPLYWIRPEILPLSAKKIISSFFWRNVKKVYPAIFEEEVKLICYDPFWVCILHATHPNMKIAYYIYDELRLNGHDNSVDKKAYKLDELACEKADVIYTMSKPIAEARKRHHDKIIVLGNGSIMPDGSIKPKNYFNKSVAFVGNFRNWIDEQLLSSLIAKRNDILFVIAGPVETNMHDYLTSLINTYENVVYYGKCPKNKMSALYKLFNAIIIPYKSNHFIKATRPIKVVESVLAGTPVITVPVDGYEETTYIRFAESVEQFSTQIDFLLSHPINPHDVDYLAFISNNTWEAKTKVIISSLA